MARALIPVRVAWGALLLLMPASAFGGRSLERLATLPAAARVLGARHVLEAALLSARGDGRPPRWSIAVDSAHAVSMLALAAISHRYRRDALVSAAISGALAAASARTR